MLGTSQALSQFDPETHLRERCCCSHFKDEESEAHRKDVTWSRSSAKSDGVGIHSQAVWLPCFSPHYATTPLLQRCGQNAG